MNLRNLSQVLVPIITAVIGAAGALWASESAIFSKYQVDVQKLILENRAKAYLDYMNHPTQMGRYRLILLGNSDVIKSMGNIYTEFCQDSREGECENTCEANKAFVVLYQAMRSDFELIQADIASEEDIYRARYEASPQC